LASIIISEEARLWAALKNLISGSSSGEQRFPFAVAGWQPSLLYFSDEPVGHSVTPAMAKAIVGFQTNLVEETVRNLGASCSEIG
jgi:hypothetical protein